MTTANLKNEVQARINAISHSAGTQQATEVLQLAVDTVGLNLDLTNVISVLNSISTAISNNTSNDDLTAINAASIALGITDKPLVSVIKSIQRGSLSFLSDDITRNITISPVNLAKSFLTVSVQKGSGTSSYSEGKIGAYLSNSTTITLAGGARVFGVVYWEVVEYV